MTATNKSFLMMVDQTCAAKLAVLGLGIQFLEVSGMTMDGNSDVQVLVTPLAKSDKVIDMPETPTPEVEIV